MRAGLSLCSGAMGPRGFHHSAAMAENFSISPSLIVEGSGALLAFIIRTFYQERALSTRDRRSVMARIVMKFGGTSVANLERIRNVARRVKAEVDRGNEVAAVVSAMSGETDRLVGFCREAAALYDAREYDTVVATGEQVTTGLLSIVLQSMGVPARSWLGWQLPVHTDG